MASRTEENYSKNQGLYVKSSTTIGRKNMKGLVENIEKKVFMYSWIWVLVNSIINAWKIKRLVKCKLYYVYEQ